MQINFQYSHFLMKKPVKFVVGKISAIPRREIIRIEVLVPWKDSVFVHEPTTQGEQEAQFQG